MRTGAVYIGGVKLGDCDVEFIEAKPDASDHRPWVTPEFVSIECTMLGRAMRYLVAIDREYDLRLLAMIAKRLGSVRVGMRDGGT